MVEVRSRRHFDYYLGKTEVVLYVQIENDFTILDMGCGGGWTIQKLAASAAQGTVYGVDYAKDSVAASRAKNAKLVQAGRVENKHASVSQLPFPEDKFDVVTAVETQYYWPAGRWLSSRRVTKTEPTRNCNGP
jgi:ubiquinone/menaquinone biosynthesis C-methylase UbiE